MRWILYHAVIALLSKTTYCRFIAKRSANMLDHDVQVHIFKRVVGRIVKMFRQPESLFEQVVRSWMNSQQEYADSYYNRKHKHSYRHL